MNFVLTNVHRHCSKHANTTRPRSRVPFVVPFYPASPNDENVKLERARRQRRVSVSHRRLSVFDVRRTTRFGGEVGWTPCGSARASRTRACDGSRCGRARRAPLPCRRPSPARARRRAAARRRRGRARSLAAAGPGAFPTRASRAARPRPRRSRGRGTSEDAPRRDTNGGGGARRRGVRRRRRRGARRVFVRRREWSAGRRNRQSPGQRRRHLFLGRGSLLGRRLERGVGVFVLGGGVLVVVADARDRLREVRRGRRRGEPERRLDRVERGGRATGSGRGPTRGTGTTTGAFVFDT